MTIVYLYTALCTVVGTSFVGKGAMNIILNIIGGKKVKETDKT